MAALQVGGWSIPGVVILDAVTDKIQNNDASAVYNRLCSPSFQERIRKERLTVEELADLCYQSPKTFHQSLRHLESLGLITTGTIVVKGRTRPALDIQIVPINPMLPEPAPIPVPFMLEVEPTSPPPPQRERKKYPPRPEWGGNAVTEVLTLLDTLQGGKPSSVTGDHYDQNLVSAKKIAAAYTPEQVCLRWRELTSAYKPHGWVSANWMYSHMPKVDQQGETSNAQSKTRQSGDAFKRSASSPPTTSVPKQGTFSPFQRGTKN